MLQRVINNWVYGGFLAAFLLLGLMPAFYRSWDLTLILVFLQLPAYMLHQMEEHDDDRFRHFVNRILGDGREILSKKAVFVINVPGVWGVNLVSILMAYGMDIGFGLIGIYLTLINAFVHLVQAIHLRCYNPGLITAVILFLPVGGIALWKICATGTVPMIYHILGLGSAVAIHLGIVVYVMSSLRKR
ncbi:MAG: HXXEE domain-containing protein [bacterium]